MTNANTVYEEAENGESHWYKVDGTPMYQVPLARGRGTRNTTVTDAKALNLVPSVTSILKVLYKEGLARWIVQQNILAALTLPRRIDESLDDFALRVMRDAQSEARTASTAGTRIHRLIEWYLSAKVGGWQDLGIPDMTPREIEILQGFAAWEGPYELEHTALEHSFAHFASGQLGYGGRIDYVGSVNLAGITGMPKTRLVCDWKSQQTTPGKPIVVYPEWGVQLAAYAHGIGEPDLPGLNVIISRNEPGRIETHLWLDDWRWPAFEALKYVYHSPLGQGYRLKRS